MTKKYIDKKYILSNLENFDLFYQKNECIITLDKWSSNFIYYYNKNSCLSNLLIKLSINPTPSSLSHIIDIFSISKNNKSLNILIEDCKNCIIDFFDKKNLDNGLK